MNTNTVLQTENLTKNFGRKVAVQNLNLTVQRGQVYGFLGVNGAGKSTTIRMLLDLMHPTRGRALILGVDPRQEPHILRRVGSLVEGAAFYPYLKGWDNLVVVGNSQGRFDRERAKHLVEQVSLEQAMNVRVKAYSTGMKQRLGIAAALLHNPDVVILDEPTNGMDPTGIHEMRQFIRELAHVHGKTVFLTSHLLGEVQQTCDQLAIIHQGKMIQEGKLTDLLSQKPELDIEVSSAEKAHQLLQERWPVEVIEAGKLRLEATREDTPSIIRHLMEHEVDIFSIMPRRQSLEDYFLHLIQRSK